MHILDFRLELNIVVLLFVILQCLLLCATISM